MKRAPNVVELDPGLRAFLRTPEGRRARKERWLGFLVDVVRRHRDQEGPDPRHWKGHAVLHEHLERDGSRWRLPERDRPAEVIVLRARAGRDERTAAANVASAR